MTPVVMLAVGCGAVLLGIVLALVAAGVMSGGKSGVSRSLSLVEVFTAAPESMQRELDPGFRERVLHPSTHWFAGIGRRLTPLDHNERMRAKLDAAGNPQGWTPERVTSAKAAGFVSGMVFALGLTLALGLGLMPPVVVTVGLPLAGYYAIDLYLYQKKHDRAESVQRDLTDSIDLLAISVEAGLGFDATLAHVAKNTKGPLAEEFSRVLQEMQIGMGRSEALRAR